MKMNIKQRLHYSPLFNELKTILRWRKLRPLNCYPHGHFYSPIVSRSDVEDYEDRIYEEQSRDTLPDVDMHRSEQLRLLKEFSRFYPELPFPENRTDKHRYYLNNQSYEYTDGIILYSFIRHFKPRRIIEIGSGFSSALMLDTKELFCNDLELTFIEPYSKQMNVLFRQNDKAECRILTEKVQDVPVEEFRRLQENDILFIDSSHVSKTGSDVNYELFRILPALKPGVLIHFHDIFYPFEYPKDWVYLGKNWNEAYLLRALLGYTDKFKIQFFSHYMHSHHAAAFADMPLTYKNPGGNIWIKKM